ncbi:hypothetical protein FD754_022372 [Muntiacus muntjak]|uniref:RRM domain-containing protein n=1 Tax=Muntiacus muntjak TaxID=9888 RepID=A0A5N3V8F4_MUNMU|nr:hypothetical protein FD754_022372 [Muntiacus muntjak]
MYHDSCPLDYKVYVGSPGNNGNKSELEVWVARNPPCFAFVEFEDPQEVANTVQELDGRTLCGCPSGCYQTIIAGEGVEKRECSYTVGGNAN